VEHIAWDDAGSLSCYPADLAVCTAEDLKQLDLVDTNASSRSCASARSPWDKLAKRLRTVQFLIFLLFELRKVSSFAIEGD
jgi:hypothetical protein